MLNLHPPAIAGTDLDQVGRTTFEAKLRSMFANAV